MNIIEVDPQLCKRWKFADRSDFEFGNIFLLSKDILKNGQIEPVLLRKSSAEPGHYEVIAGSRRWKACLDAQIKLKGVVQDLTDEQAAMVQIKENQKLPLCDYSKGIYYARILQDKKITMAKLAEHIGCSRAKLDNYLAFEKVPSDIWNAVGNLARVSSRSAAMIYSLSKKGEQYKEALIELAGDIRKGAGSVTLEKKVLADVQGSKGVLEYQQNITLPSGQSIGKWTKKGLQFDKDIPLNQKEIADILIQYFQKVI